LNLSDLRASLELSLTELSLYSIKEEGLRPNIRATFRLKNLSDKRTYTLSFPNAQRYDYVVKTEAGLVVYKWSADKMFAEAVGTTLINPGDALGYTELIPVADFYRPLVVGDYVVEASLANYPEITAKAILKVVSMLTPSAASAVTGPPVEPTTKSEAVTSPDNFKEPELPKAEQTPGAQSSRNQGPAEKRSISEPNPGSTVP
jgi:hypothetical protein